MARRSWVLLAMSLALLSINLDFTVVNLGLADMQRDLGTSLSELQWVINGYTLALAGAVVVAGRLGDTFGRKRVYLAGLITFTAAAIAAALAPSVGVLIATRAVQGLGAATVYTVSLAILGNAFPPEERGRALGVWTAVAALGLAAGPLVGGAVVETGSWRWIFVLLVPFAAASAVITAVKVRESRDEDAPRSLDLRGVITSTIALVAFAALLIESGDWGLISLRSAALAAIAVASAVVFVLVERRTKAPLLDLGLFRNPRFLGASVTSFVLAFVAWAALFFLPLDFETARGYSTLTSGLLLLPCTVTWALVSLAAGRVVARAGTRLPMAAGIGLAAVGLAVLALHAPPIGVVLVALGVVGTGIGLSFAPMTKAALDAVPAAHAGMASGALLMTRMIGATFGPAACGAAFRAAEESASGSVSSTFSTGLTAAMALAAGLAAVGACIVFVLGRKPSGDAVAAASVP